jgi:hypothetical protein
VIPESLFPRYGVFEGSLMDSNGDEVGRMVLMRLPGETPTDDKYVKCMFTGGDGGSTGCGPITLGEGEGGAYSQIYPPARRVISLVFGKDGMVRGRVVQQPIGKIGVINELEFFLMGLGDRGEISKGKGPVIQAVRRFIEKELGKEGGMCIVIAM